MPLASVDEINCQVNLDASGPPGKMFEMEGPGSAVAMCYDTRRQSQSMFCQDFTDGGPQRAIRVQEIDPNDLAIITVRLSRNGSSGTVPVQTRRISTVMELKEKLRNEYQVQMAPAQMVLRNHTTNVQMKNNNLSLADYQVQNNTRIDVIVGGLRGG